MEASAGLPSTPAGKKRMDRLPDHMREEWLFEDEAARLTDEEAAQMWARTVQEVRDLTRFIELSRTVIVGPFMTGDFETLAAIRAVVVQFCRKRRAALQTMSVFSARQHDKRIAAPSQAACSKSINNPQQKGPRNGHHS